MTDPLQFEAIPSADSKSVSSSDADGFSSGSLLMALIAIVTAILVALFILRIIIKIWQRSRQQKKKAQEAALLYSVSRGASGNKASAVRDRDERFASSLGVGTAGSQTK